MKITVTQRDINEGVRGSCIACPVAVAATRAAGKTVFVTGTRARLSDPDAYTILPDHVRNFVFAFDNAQAVEPFEFDIEFA